jgi:predicted metal-dependent hydrolase
MAKSLDLPAMPRPSPRAPASSPSSEAGLQLHLPLFELPAPPRAPAPPAAAPQQLLLHPRSNRQVLLDAHPIGYELKRARRRSIGFVVGEEGLSVSAPRWVPQGDIDAALQAKAGWIVRKLREQGERVQRLAAARVQWRDGVELPFLGRPLQVVLGGSGREAQWCDATHAGAPARLRLPLPAETEPTRIRDALLRWLQRQALQHYTERCDHYAARLGVQVRQLRLSAAHTRWGSATSSGTIRLHWRLMHFPPEVIDYVVVHELAHLREMNHSPAFWAVVHSVLPDADAARLALKHTTLPVFD